LSAGTDCDIIDIAVMAQLIVRNLEETTVRALKRRAAQHGRSAEEEHREILRLALGTHGNGFKAALMSIPAVGDDSDFERNRDLARDVDL